MLKGKRSPRHKPAQGTASETLVIQASPEVGGYKVPAAARYLGGISLPSVYRLVQRGLLRPNRALRVLVFAKKDLDRFLEDGMR
jgi:hypothetical protein